MTAVIGILNKEGAVVAADSAVTMRRGRREKISNSADKMIRLSDVQPISVIIFADATFMGIPWDLIVRWYRHLRGGIAFPTFKDHVNDFLGFLVRESFFCSEEQKKDYLGRLFRGFFRELDEDTPMWSFNDEHAVENLDEVIEGYRAVSRMKAEEYKGKGICPSFNDYTVDSFKEFAAGIVDENLEDKLPDDLFAAVRDDLMECFYYFLIHRNGDMTGLVFTGYGRDDKYPSSLCVRVVLGFDGHLASYVQPEDDVAISDERPSAVLPYAQTDVMETLVKGVDPQFDYNIGLQAEEELDRMLNDFAWNLRRADLPDEAVCSVADIPYEDIVEEFKRTTHTQAKKARNNKVFSGVENIEVRDMARLAEEMISITSLKRHINFDDEGVGGLVDLAAITRDKGFTWLNRKGWYGTLGEDGFKI